MVGREAAGEVPEGALVHATPPQRGNRPGHAWRALQRPEGLPPLPKRPRKRRNGSSLRFLGRPR